MILFFFHFFPTFPFSSPSPLGSRGSSLLPGKRAAAAPALDTPSPGAVRKCRARSGFFCLLISSRDDLCAEPLPKGQVGPYCFLLCFSPSPPLLFLSLASVFGASVAVARAVGRAAGYQHLLQLAGCSGGSSGCPSGQTQCPGRHWGGRGVCWSGQWGLVLLLASATDWRERRVGWGAAPERLCPVGGWYKGITRGGCHTASVTPVGHGGRRVGSAGQPPHPSSSHLAFTPELPWQPGCHGPSLWFCSLAGLAPLGGGLGAGARLGLAGAGECRLRQESSTTLTRGFEFCTAVRSGS